MPLCRTVRFVGSMPSRYRSAPGRRAGAALPPLGPAPVPPREAVVVAAPPLHEPPPALQEPPRHQALPAEVVRLLDGVDLLVERALAVVQPVQLQDVGRLLRQ